MILLSITLLICTIVICYTIIYLNDNSNKEKYKNALRSIDDLCDKLNETFPGSNISLIEKDGDIKICGELKYIKEDE